MMGIKSRPQQYSDRARRASDAVSLAMTVHGREAVNRWMALRLSDGGTDGALYPTKGHATRHQLHPHQCAYVMLPPDGMSPRQAENYLRFVAGLYAAGADLADPATHTPMPQDRGAARRLIRAVARAR